MPLPRWLGPAGLAAVTVAGVATTALVLRAPPAPGSANSRQAVPPLVIEPPPTQSTTHRSAARSGPGEPPARVTRLAGDGAWTWFQGARAVHHRGRFDRTYVGFVDAAGDVWVLSRDSATGAISRHVVRRALQRDDHAAPALEVLPDGRIAVFYSRHDGSRLYFRISRRPEEITAFGPERTVGTNTAGPAGFTYPNPIYLSAEHRTYVFFRGAGGKPTVTWSSDGLRSWAPARPLLSGPTQRPYVKYASNGRDTIEIAFDDGHPRDVADNSVYALTYRSGRLRTTEGTPVGTLTRPVPMAGLLPVYDGAGPEGRAWLADAALDERGDPVLLFATFTDHDTVHHYHYARWDGQSWRQTEFATAGGSIDSAGKEPQYFGGLTVDPAQLSTVYGAVQRGAGWVVQRWRLAGDGSPTGPPQTLSRPGTGKNVRPVVPAGPPGPVRVLWMSGRYTHWKGGYRTAIDALTDRPGGVSRR